jgi:ADP-dependent phosphofructokinase/glucokinase
MTREQYHQLVTTFDQRKIQDQIERIPLNINRAGKHYQKLIKQIYEQTNQTRRMG